MSDKRFVLDKLYYPIMTPIEKISVGRNYMTYGEVVDKLNELSEENEQLKSLVNACEYGQKSLMEEMKNSDEALDKIWEIMKSLYGVSDG